MNVGVWHLPMRIWAMIGEDAIAPVFQAQIARYPAQGAKETGGFRVACPRRNHPRSKREAFGNISGRMKLARLLANA
jgi:hypothetical protein